MKLAFFSLPTSERGGRVDEWFTLRRFAVILGLLMVVLFPDVITGLRTFVFRDYGLFGYPLAHYYRESFWRGELPLWNPLNNCGLPFLAQWNTMVLYPPSLFYLIFPLPWSLAIFCLGHLYLAGLGMYFLAYRWTGHRYAACVAGLAFAFNGLLLNCLMWPNNIAALGWMPWVILCVEKAWQTGGRALVLAAIIGAIQMLAGAPEVFMFTWLVSGALFLHSVWTQKSAATRSASRFLIMIALIIGLTAAQSMPFGDLLKYSQREAGYSTGSVSMPRWGWANLFVPLFHCSRSSSGVFFQTDEAWTSSYYPGIGILLLAALAVFALRQWRTGFFGIVAASGLLLCLGENGYVYSWLRRTIPLTGLMNFPIKFVVLVIFSGPLLAAFAVARYLGAPIGLQQKLSRNLLQGGAAFLLIIMSILWVSYRFPAADEQWKDTLLNGLARALFLLFILLLLWGVTRFGDSKRRILHQLALLLALWLDVVVHVPWQNPAVDSSIYSLILPPLQQLNPRPAPGESRAMLTKGAIIKFHETMIPSPFDGYLCSRLGLYDNCNLLEHIPKVDGFYSLYLREERETRFSLYISTNTVLPHLADFLGVSQVNSRTNYLEWEPRASYLPLITTGQKPTFVEPEKTLNALVSPGFNPSQTVLLPVEARPFIRVTNQTNSKILSQQFLAHHVIVEVESTEPALLVIAQVFYHPWKGYVGGVPTRLWRANHAFQAIEVPAGRQQVRLVYEDRWFLIGATISAATLLGCLVASLFLQKPDPAQIHER